MLRKYLQYFLAIEGILRCHRRLRSKLCARTHSRDADRSLASSDLVQLPLVDGGAGTIDFLVSAHTLGSFLEVEASGASGGDVVVPIGFAGEDGKLAVIETPRAHGRWQQYWMILAQLRVLANLFRMR